MVDESPQEFTNSGSISLSVSVVEDPPQDVVPIGSLAQTGDATLLWFIFAAALLIAAAVAAIYLLRGDRHEKR